MKFLKFSCRYMKISYIQTLVPIGYNTLRYVISITKYVLHKNSIIHVYCITCISCSTAFVARTLFRVTSPQHCLVTVLGQIGTTEIVAPGTEIEIESYYEIHAGRTHPHSRDPRGRFAFNKSVKQLGDSSASGQRYIIITTHNRLVANANQF